MDLSSETGGVSDNPLLGFPFVDLERFYEVRGQLGSGISGIIRECVSKDTGNKFACKTMSKNGMDLKSVQTEIRALKKLSHHPFVVKIESFLEEEENVNIVMELCEGGDLLNRIRKRKFFTERNAARVCRQLLSVIHYCHGKGIMHRDLKPENILLTRSDSDTDIKVADFGEVVFFKPETKMTKLVGTPYYIAPEVLNRSYGPEADMWSLGVILYVLLGGSPPFWEKTREGIFEKIKSGNYKMDYGPWNSVSENAKDLVRRMLTVDPSERITAQTAKGHPWIVQHCPSEKTNSFTIPLEISSSSISIENCRSKTFHFPPRSSRREKKIETQKNSWYRKMRLRGLNFSVPLLAQFVF